MKKLAVALAALMVLSVGVPAFAAELTMDGSVESNIEWNEKYNAEDDVAEGWAGKSVIDLGFGVDGEENGVSAHLSLNAIADDDRAYGGESATPFGLTDLELDKAWIETNGAFWNGGPDLNTRLGSLDVAHSDLIATVEENGASIDGFQVGNATIGGFGAWNNGERNVDAGVNVDYTFENGNAKATLVNGGVDEDMAYAVEGKVSPVETMDIEGLFAGTKTGEERSEIYKVETSIAANENTTITAGYRDLMAGVGTIAADADTDNVMPGAFAPTYYNTTTDDDDNRTDIIGIANGLGEDEKVDQNAGYNVGIETVQGNVALKANYDNPHHEAVLGANTELAGYKLGAESTFNEDDATFSYAQTELSAEKDFALTGMDVTGKYTATLVKDQSAKHEIEADAAVNAIPQLQGLGVNGKVTVENGGDDVTWETGAEYTAPNGIELGAGYHSVDGANFNAGVKVAF